MLDARFCRTNLGRAAVLSTIPTSKLTDGIAGTSKLPAFWKQALNNIRELDLTSLKVSKEGALSQPVWGSPTHPGPKLNPTWAKLWNKLECNTLHNVFKDHEASTPYTIAAKSARNTLETTTRIYNFRENISQGTNSWKHGIH